MITVHLGVHESCLDEIEWKCIHPYEIQILEGEHGSQNSLKKNE